MSETTVMLNLMTLRYMLFMAKLLLYNNILHMYLKEAHLCVPVLGNWHHTL